MKRGSGMSLLLGCDLPLSGLSGCLSLELFLIGGQLLSTVAAFWNDSHIKDGLRQYGEGCDGRRVQVSQWNTEACFSPLMFSLLSVQCVFHQTSAQQMLHPECRRSGTGDAFCVYSCSLNVASSLGAVKNKKQKVVGIRALPWQPSKPEKKSGKVLMRHSTKNELSVARKRRRNGNETHLVGKKANTGIKNNLRRLQAWQDGWSSCRSKKKHLG